MRKSIPKPPKRDKKPPRYLKRTKRIGTISRRGLIIKVQSQANLYARLRDCGGQYGNANCISCGKLHHYSDMDGGHFIPTTSSDLRFEEHNINAQCRKCNRFLGGNARHYYYGMVKKYGQDIVDGLEAREFLIKKWTIKELMILLERYNKLIKEMDR